MLKWLPAAAFLLLASPAVAQQACGPTREIEAELERQFQERKIATGEMRNGGSLVIYTTRDGATWTAVREMSGGVSCLLGIGERWRAVSAGRGA